QIQIPGHRDGSFRALAQRQRNRPSEPAQKCDRSPQTKSPDSSLGPIPSSPGEQHAGLLRANPCSPEDRETRRDSLLPPVSIPLCLERCRKVCCALWKSHPPVPHSSSSRASREWTERYALLHLDGGSDVGERDVRRQQPPRLLCCREPRGHRGG